MAQTSARLFRLLSLLGTRPDWSADELAGRLGVSTRTVRRDVDALRELDFPVHATLGPQGGYRLGSGTRLPPLVLDDDQAVAIAIALRTAPATVTGIEESVARALTTLRETMPARLRAEVDDLDVVRVDNYWEFHGPPIDADTLRAVGAAVRREHLLRFDLARPDGSVAAPPDADFVPPRRVEPHHLAVWNGRWYLVAYDPAAGGRDTGGRDGTDAGWAVYRVDRIHPKDPTGVGFTRRELPAESVDDFVQTFHDRGDTLMPWPYQGSAVLEYPARFVARWAPGGSVVEPVGPDRCRLILGAWSWEGVVGLFATFDSPLHDVEPAAFRAACRRCAARLAAVPD